MKAPGSNFVSFFGLGFLAVLILVAAYFDMAALEGFLILVLILCLIAFLWGRLSLRKMDFRCLDEECCGFPGQRLEAECLIQNKKLLPLIWLDLSFPIGKKTCLDPEEDETDGESHAIARDGRYLRSAFLWVMPHQRISWRQSAMAVHRGVCRVEEVKLHSGDGFGLSTQTSKLRLLRPLKFVVYPKIVPVDVRSILNNMSEMESAKNGFYTDRTLLETTRDYREGDSFKNINWRLLARRDELQVNVYEKLTMRRVCFMPDLYSFTHVEEVEEEGHRPHEERVVEREEMEEMFSLMASIIVKLHERDVLCTLVLPARGNEPERLVIPENGETQVMELLGALAEVEYDAETIRVPIEAISMNRHMLGQLYVFSKSMKRSCLGREVPGMDELGAISIYQESPALTEGGDGSYFSETDFRTQ